MEKAYGCDSNQGPFLISIQYILFSNNNKEIRDTKLEYAMSLMDTTSSRWPAANTSQSPFH